MPTIERQHDYFASVCGDQEAQQSAAHAHRSPAVQPVV
jgi:hypothetical protein